MKILATDLDRTLLPNGEWECDKEAINLFNELTAAQNVLVVYVTGRNLDLTEKAIKEYGVRFPDVLCGDVGTSIRKYQNGEWNFDEGWDRMSNAASPRWSASAIKSSGCRSRRHSGAGERSTQPVQAELLCRPRKTNEQILKNIDELDQEI